MTACKPRLRLRAALDDAEGSRARIRTVDVGARNNQHAEIVGGLAAGARVILHPSDRIVEGVRATNTAQASP